MKREEIKWKPFNSIINTKELLNSVSKNLYKYKMPTLNEDQINQLERMIILSYYTKEKLNIIYYKNGNIHNIISNIKKIDSIGKTIVLQNNTTLFFNQILKIIYQ